MNALDPSGRGTAVDRSSGRLSRAVIAHPVRALALTGIISVAVAIGVTTAVNGLGTGAPRVPGPRGQADAGLGASAAVSRSTSGRMNAGAGIGRALLGRAPQYESLALAETQANQAPAGASVDPKANTIRFTGPNAALTIVANPPTGRDMAFRAAGLENPTIEVARGAVVTVHFVNGDNDSAHGWLLIAPVVTVGDTPHGPWAFPGSYASILGDPTNAGQAAETISFRASRGGTYRYECPVPGHAAMGMQGGLTVGT